MGDDKKREFTGVWIPKHIIEDKNLKPVDRLIYAEISCFEVCTMTNATLADRAGCSEPTASRSVSRLKEYGYIKIIGFNGRIRKMIRLADNPVPPSQNDKAASSKTTKQPNQNDSQDNNIDNKENTSVAIATGEAPASFGNPDINEAFEYWQQIIGYKLEGNRQRNRNACNNLIKKHGLDGVKRLIGGVAKANQDRYAPRISDFVSLQSKYNDLIAWGNKTVKGKQKVVKI